MVSTFTPNIQLEEPARGDDVGVWDTPVNSNMTVIDLVTGAIATIPLNNSPIVLSAAQFKSKTIVFGSTLTGNVVITFPASFTKSYEIYNGCTGSSAFTITLQTTAAGAQAICPPPGEFIDAINDGLNLKFKNLGRVGSYFDYAGSSVPGWVSGCTVPPYLNCDGTAFNGATYPALAIVLAGTTLPDRRGTTGYTLNQGTGRLTTANGGLDGNTNLSVKAAQATLGTSNLPAYTPTGAVSQVTGTANLQGGSIGGSLPNVALYGQNTSGVNILGPLPLTLSAQSFAGNSQGGTSAPFGSIGTGVVAGITMIRAG